MKLERSNLRHPRDVTRLRRHRQATKPRRGGAVTELTVCLPVIALLVFASIEACSMIFLRQALSATAYEGVRVAIQEDATNQMVIDRCNEVLNGRKVQGATPTVDATDITTVLPGSPVTVTVSAACDANSIGPAWFFGGRTLSTSASMVKEG